MTASILIILQHREKLRRARKAQEARARAARAQAEATPPPGAGFNARANFPPGAGGGAGFPGGLNPQDFSNLLFDQEIMSAFQVIRFYSFFFFSSIMNIETKFDSELLTEVSSLIEPWCAYKLFSVLTNILLNAKVTLVSL